MGLVALNRPHRANAYDQGLLEALQRALEDLAADPDLRALVVHPGSCRHFCSGADREELLARRPEEAPGLLSRRVFADLAAFPHPTVAAVRGAALGGGLELALACDLRVVASDARFAFPETSLGLIPAAGGSLRAPRLLGLTLAREMVLFGRELDASEALRHGLASEVCPPEAVLDRALAWARRAAERDPLANRLAKQALDLAVPPGAALEYEGAAQGLLYSRNRLQEPRL